MNKKVLVSAFVLVAVLISMPCCSSRSHAPDPSDWVEETVWEQLIIQGEYLVDSFEYESNFYNESSSERSAFLDMHWYWERPDANVQTSTDIAKTGSRSSKHLFSPANDGISSIMCGVRSGDPPEYDQPWNTQRVGMIYEFILPSAGGIIDNHGFLINISHIDEVAEVWRNAIVAMDITGTIHYAYGWALYDFIVPFTTVETGLTLELDTWYRQELWVDWAQFGDFPGGMIYRIHIDGVVHGWALPLYSWSTHDWQLRDHFSVLVYFVTLGGKGGFTAGITAYADNVECYRGPPPP